MLLTNEVAIKLNTQRNKYSKLVLAFLAGIILFSVIIIGFQLQSSRKGTSSIPSNSEVTANDKRPDAFLSPGTVDKSNVPTTIQTAPGELPDEPVINLGSVGTFQKWSKVELSFSGPDNVGYDAEINPSTIKFDVKFQSPEGNIFVVPAFFDGDGAGGLEGNIWKVRFNPDTSGEWGFEASKPDYQSINYVGEFEVLAAKDCGPSTGSLQDLNCYGRLEYAGEHYLKFENGDYWIKGGIDDPENFLGNAFGGWDEKKAAIDYLSSHGVNSIYVITNNIGGDRNDTWPWLGNTPQQAKANSDKFNFAKLEEWEDFFSYVQSKGIVLHIILNDDSAWTGYDHDIYLREMTARFGHHPGIIWNIGEEANEVYSTKQQESLAAKIQQIDPYNHPVTVHRKSPWPFIENKFFDLTSIQIGDGSQDFTSAKLSDYNSIVTEHWEKSSAVCHTIPVMIDETPRVTVVDEKSRTKLRTQVLYPIFFGGGNFELHYQDAYGQDGSVTIQNLEPMLDDMFRARQLLGSLPFYEMEACNSLLSSHNNYCFGKKAEVYAVYYQAGGSESIDLSKVQGEFDLIWFNPRTGDKTPSGSISGGGFRTISAPDNEDWVLLLERSATNELVSFQNDSSNLFARMVKNNNFNVYLPSVMDCDG